MPTKPLLAAIILIIMAQVGVPIDATFAKAVAAALLALSCRRKRGKRR